MLSLEWYISNLKMEDKHFKFFLGGGNVFHTTSSLNMGKKPNRFGFMEGFCHSQCLLKFLLTNK